MADDQRSVRLVLVDGAGRPCGTTPAFAAEEPWWQEVGPVVRAAKTAFAVDVVVLRLLDAGPWPGGSVTYLAELTGGVPQATWMADQAASWRVSDDHPLRLPYARPGGPAADLAWADAHLARLGRRRVAPAEQVRTWNLSSLWRLPTVAGDVWLKVVPPFFAHEPAVIALLADPLLPPLLAGEPGRSLLDGVGGVDGYDASSAAWLDQLGHLVRLQAGTFDRLPDLLAAGVPDRRADPLAAGIARALAAAQPSLGPGEATALARLVAEVRPRLARAAALGVPDALVHGDAHPGNARFAGGPLETTRCVGLLDWGDAVVGQPLLDLAVVASYRPGADDVLAGWLALWQRALPHADVAAAWDAVRPLADLRAAALYQEFLDAIEPSEHPYHRDDPLRCLRRALTAP